MADVVVLLPARNASGTLRGWLRSAARCCDAVVALDDGSTDSTADILASHPLVTTLLRNPQRPSSTGWDDGANRARLLEAAAALSPRWILSLDADESIDADDAQALRSFLATDALPGFAYGLQHCRMWRGRLGEERYDPEVRWVYRLFAYERGQRFPDDRLHFHPVPTSIPRDRWLPTTIRLKHFGAATPALVRARLRKYAESDPHGEYRVDFGGMDTAPRGRLPRWRPRPPGLPALLTAAGGRPEADELGRPDMTAVVIARDDADVIVPRISAVVEQDCAEVIAVVSGSRRTAAAVAEELPDVRLVELRDPAFPGRARNAGLNLARGEVVSFPGSHVELRPGALKARLAAHEDGWAMVSGAVLNGTDTKAGWASYFLDHSAALPGRPAGLIDGPPASCSYARGPLVEIGGFPEHLRAGEDTWVNRTLFRLGHQAWFEPTAVLVHHSPCRRTRRLLIHHFTRGRGLARIGVADGAAGVRETWRSSAVLARIRRIAAQVDDWGGEDLRRRRRQVRSHIALGAAAYRAGFVAELLRPRLATMRALRGKTATTVVLAGLDRREGGDAGRADVLLLASRSRDDGVLRLLSVPRDYEVDLKEHGPQKINAAYALGGPSLLIEAVDRAFGVRAHGAISVDFDGFRRVIDRLGGVEIDVPRPMFDPLSTEGRGLASAEFAAGRQRMDGAQALAYARTRRLDGDTARRHRHLELLQALARQATSVRSPVRLARVAPTVMRAVNVAVPLRHLARFARRGRPRTIHVRTLQEPLVRGEFLPDGRYVQRGDPEQVRTFVRLSLGLPVSGAER